MRMIRGSIPQFRVVRAPLFVLILAGLGMASGMLVPVESHAQTVHLRYEFTEGMELRYETVQSTSMELPGGMGTMDQSQTQVARLQVLSVDDEGNAHLRNTIESIRMEIQSPMGSQVFDSTDDEAPADPSLRPLAAMVGVSIEVVMGADGQVQEVVDMTSAIEEMLSEYSAEERAMLEQTFSEDTWSELASRSFQVLPADPISAGESWEDRIELPMAFGTLVSEQIFTLEEADEASGVATIGIAGSIGGLEPDPENPMAAMIDFGGGEILGSGEFDLERGIFLSSVIRTTMEMNVQGQAMNSVTEVETRLLP